MEKFKGIIAVVLSAFFFGFAPILVKMTFESGSSPMAMVVLRFVLVLPFYGVILAWKRVPMAVTKNEIFKIAILSIFGTAATALLLYMSYSYIAVGLTTTLHFIYPLLVTVAEVIFFKMHFRWTHGLALALALGGIVFLCDPGSMNFTGVALALASGVTYTFYIMFLAKARLSHLGTMKLAFYSTVFNAISLLLFTVLTGNMIVRLDAMGWGLTLIASLMSSLAAMTLFQYGVTETGPSTAAILSTAEPLTSVVFGILLLNENSDWMKWTGCFLIVLGVVVLVLGPSLQKKWSKKKAAGAAQS